MERLKEYLLEKGASLVGFAHIGDLYQNEVVGSCPRYPYGVSIALAIPPEIIRGIQEKPTRDYFDAYHSLNHQLDELATDCKTYLNELGYEAYAQTVKETRETADFYTPMPHKTVAVMGGLGWIGRCALLVTPEYGSAVRLTSVLTDAPLETDEPVHESHCGNCTACYQACPGKAVTGKLWEPGVKRETLFQPLKCRTKARELAKENLNEEITLCGKCIEVCPYTRKYTRE